MVLGHNLEDTARTQDVRISHNVTFDSMLLAPETLLGLKTSGFYKPSPIQLHGVPLGKCGFDLLLEAKSGTGKTAVFTIIALEHLDLSKGLQAIMLAPTREIAAQICDVLKQIGRCYKGLNIEVVMGGLPVYEDIAKFQNRKVHMVVASPGRLRQLIQEKHINVSAVRLLVLDEADKLLTKSFLADINYIFSILPSEKQVIMSSATYTEVTKEFIKKYVQSAQHVCPDTNSILLGITQKVTIVKHHSNIVKQTKLRFDELLKILSQHPFKQCLIFCNYQARIAELHKMLRREKWPAQQLYGQQEQLDRLDALKSLQEYKCRILIATDLAARGIDASNVDLVINFEPPFEWQTYLHRIGRAGRFGSYGMAVTILSETHEKNKFIQMVKDIKAPLNLSYLWNDEKFIEESDEPAHNGFSVTDEDSQTGSVDIHESIQNGCSNTSTEELIELETESLWEALTRDCKAENTTKNEDDEHHIKSFDDLCNEFDKSDIESFSDLLSSLNDHQSAKAHFDPPIPSLCCIKIIHVEEKTEKAKLSNSVTNEMHIKDHDSNINNHKKEKEKVISKEHITNGGTRKNEAFLSEEKTDTSDDGSEKMTEMELALKIAGLPTAFGSTKHKKSGDIYLYRSSKSSENYEYSKPVIQAVNRSDSINNDNYHPSTSKGSRGYQSSSNRSKHNGYVNSSDAEPINEGHYKHCNKDRWHGHERREVESEISESETSEMEESSENESSAHMNKKFNHHKSKKHTSNNVAAGSDDDYGYNSFNQQYAKPYSSKTYSKHENFGNSLGSKKTTREAYEKYMNWYNNLKWRVKQVEFAVYYEEMSKLQ